MFTKTGLLNVDEEGCPISEDELLLVAAEAGADDLENNDGIYDITCNPDALWKVKADLEAAGITVTSASITYLPQNTISVAGDDAVKLLKLMDALDEHDDVQETYGNFEIEE